MHTTFRSLIPPLTLGITMVFVLQSARADTFDPPSGYYNPAEGLEASALKNALHSIIDNHTVIAYSWPPFQDVDESASSPSDVDLIYSDATRSKNDNGGSVGDWNREHLWPRSFGIGNNGADNSDIFNLRPSDVQVNSERGNLIFDDTDPALEQSLQFSAPGSSKDNDSWEPRDDEKGDIARSCMYMDVRYDGSDSNTTDLELDDLPNSGASRFGSQLTLLRWHRLDPVDQRERERNHAVYTSWQGNRNPFIDQPLFAELIFMAEYPDMDDDADGVSDWWEYRKLASATAGASDDNDGDGASLLLEFAAGSDPADPNDGPMAELSSINNQFYISYRLGKLAEDNGVQLIIERSVSMNPTSWVPVSPTQTSRSSLNAEQDLVVATLPTMASEDREFFRLRATSP